MMNRTRSIRPVKINSFNMETSNYEGMTVGNNLAEVMESLLAARKAVVEKLVNIDGHIELVKQKMQLESGNLTPCQTKRGRSLGKLKENVCTECKNFFRTDVNQDIKEEHEIIESILVEKLQDHEILPPDQLKGSNLARKLEPNPLQFTVPGLLDSFAQANAGIPLAKNMVDKEIQVSISPSIKNSKSSYKSESPSNEKVLSFQSPIRFTAHRYSRLNSSEMKKPPPINQGDQVRVPTTFNLEPERILTLKRVVQNVQNPMKQVHKARNNQISVSPPKRKMLRRITKNSQAPSSSSKNDTSDRRILNLTQVAGKEARGQSGLSRPRSTTRDRSFRLEAMPRGYFHRTIYTKV